MRPRSGDEGAEYGPTVMLPVMIRKAVEVFSKNEKEFF